MKGKEWTEYFRLTVRHGTADRQTSALGHSSFPVHYSIFSSALESTRIAVDESSRHVAERLLGCHRFPRLVPPVANWFELVIGPSQACKLPRSPAIERTTPCFGLSPPGGSLTQACDVTRLAVFTAQALLRRVVGETKTVSVVIRAGFTLCCLPRAATLTVLVLARV